MPEPPASSSSPPPQLLSSGGERQRRQAGGSGVAAEGKVTIDVDVIRVRLSCDFGGGRPARVATSDGLVDRLDEVAVEARRLALLTASRSPQPVRAMTVICRPHGSLAQAATDLVAAEQRQADVEQHHVGPERVGGRQRGLAVVRHAHLVPLQREQRRHAFGTVLMIVHHQDLHRPAAGTAAGFAGDAREPAPAAKEAAA